MKTIKKEDEEKELNKIWHSELSIPDIIHVYNLHNTKKIELANYEKNQALTDKEQHMLNLWWNSLTVKAKKAVLKDWIKDWV